MQPSLELRAAPQLTLSPQVVQAIRILQLSAADLEHEVEEALARNPFLERTEPNTATSPGASEDRPASPTDTTGLAPQPDGAVADRDEDAAWPQAAASGRDEDAPIEDACARSTTLRDHLIEQLAGSRLDDADRLVVETVIDGLDDDGYLRQTTQELAGALPAELKVDPQDIELAVRFVQSMDPAGVGARSLAECLALQLDRLPARTPDAALAKRIVREHIDLLALHDSARLSQELDCDPEAIRRANVLIRSLDPRPGARFGDAAARYVVPEVVARRVDGRWVASIHPAARPRLRINRVYADALERDRAGNGALARHLQEARWLIRNVQQRFDTIQRVAQVIVERQRRFLELGELAMRPMMLRDVARELGLHPSTVSRVTNNKYMQTPSGLIELKRFFSTRLTNEQDGSSCSSTAIRALIRELIAAEPAAAPLSDVRITRILASRSIKVARRTVAKYRALLGIPAVEARRMSAAAATPQRASMPRPIAALAQERRTAQRSAPRDRDAPDPTPAAAHATRTGIDA